MMMMKKMSMMMMMMICYLIFLDHLPRDERLRKQEERIGINPLTQPATYGHPSVTVVLLSFQVEDKSMMKPIIE